MNRPGRLYRGQGRRYTSFMAILKIARMGHPVLRRRAMEVEDPGNGEIHTLIADMQETLADANGAGLAAPQVHAPLRIVMFEVPTERGTDEIGDEIAPLRVLINPVIEPLTEEMEQGWEGCLSVPGMIGAVPRYTRIGYSGLLPDGQPFRTTASGFHARVVQHECDHLDGILYPMRIADLSLFGFVEEMNRAVARPDDADRAVAQEEAV